MKIAVQTRPWGPEKNRNHLPDVLAEVVSAGYDGIEIGAQHLDISKPAEFRKLLEGYGLQPAAIHMGGEIWDPKSVQEARDNTERIIDFAAAAGAPCLAYSGKITPNKSEEEFCYEAEGLNRIGEMCQKNDLVLAYHNHYWEIENGCRELRYICAHTDPLLVSLCLDVAWVKRGGGDPASVVREFLHRIAYCHLKDTTDDEWKELGNGKLDFAALFAALSPRAFDWFVVEQDESPVPAVDSLRISRQYLKDRWGM